MERHELPLFLTLPRSARTMGLSIRQLREAIERGELRPVRLRSNGWLRLDVAEIQRWLCAQRGSDPQDR